MTEKEEQTAILREIGQKIQECRALVDKIDGGFTVRLQLDKLLDKVSRWGETDRAMSATPPAAELERPTQASEKP